MRAQPPADPGRASSVPRSRALRRAAYGKDGPDHISSHRALLLHQNAQAAAERFDAVIVPTGRSAENLLTAAAVARRAGKTLVVLCSQASDPGAALRQVASAAPADVIVLDLGDYRFPLAFDSDGVAQETAPWEQRDTATKRNLGLVLARLMGWRRVLFLDDDVRELRGRQLRKGMSLARPEGFQAVGWSCFDFPDNSVVCHAYRLLPAAPYGRQTSFIGGGGLALCTDGDLPFFPDVYNEDWFFLFDLLAERSVALAGDLRQLRYDPFQPALAARQEFGDLLGEGLFRLLHRPGPASPGQLAADAATEGFWGEAIRRRSRFMDRIVAELSRDSPPLDVARAVESVARARDELGKVQPARAVEWVHRWRRDLDSWRAYLSTLPPVTDRAELEALPKALVELGLDESCSWPWRAGAAIPSGGKDATAQPSDMPHPDPAGIESLVRPDPHVHDEADTSVTSGLERRLDLIDA